ncbi:helix-turn-helix domain-containing protein [Sphingomonas sp. UYP23]
MTARITPGAYLKMRRQAQGFSIEDVAARIATELHLSERMRVLWIKSIEGDVMPATFRTIVALRQIFRFDLTVLAQLEAIGQGVDIPHPPLCRICACSERDPCFDADGSGCWWVLDDLLCNVCGDKIDGPSAESVPA